MLPQIGLSEMLLLAVLALMVLGPRDLSIGMRKLGRWTGKLRALAWEFRQSFEEIGRQAELDELRKEVADLKRQSIDEVEKELKAAERDVSKDLSAISLEAKMEQERQNAAGQNGADHGQNEDSQFEAGQDVMEPLAEPAPVEEEMKAGTF